MWQNVPCFKCGKYKPKGKMEKITFKGTKSTYGYICRTCLRKENDAQKI